MTYQVKFVYKDVNYKFKRKVEDFDRNYDDEPYAYWLEDIVDLFEMNVFKDKNGKLTKKGYINVFYSTEDCAPYDCIENVTYEINY